MTMADESLVMRGGIVEQRGRPLDLDDRPDNSFVAGFIGSPAMNLIPGLLRRSADQIQVEFAYGTRLPAPRRSGAIAGEEGQKVIYGVRPEHLTADTEGQGIKTAVGVVEPTGANTEVYSRFCDVDLISIFRERHDFSAGDSLRLMPDHERTHLFDAGTGRALISS